MLCKMLKGKIHRARVTDACLEYEGSITIDPILLEAAGLLPNEAVQIWNLANGERFETYTVSGARGTGEICINGAAARRVAVGDQVIIAGFTWMEAEAARRWEPRVVLVDEANRVRSAPPVRAAAGG